MAKVLVVDDSLSVRKVVERALIGRQIEVVCAATGTEALERIEREAPDVVVCDVVMPDRDGYEICEFVKRHPRLASTPVLLMSGIVNDEVRERAARVQSADVLSKPFAAEDLLRKLDVLLASAAAAAPAPPPAPLADTEPAPALLAPAVSGSNGHAAEPPAPAVPRVAAASPPKAASAGAAPTSGAHTVLEQFAAIDGVQWAVLVDREGFLLDASADAAVDPEIAGALGACLAESSEGLGRELGRGALHGMILEYERGMVVLYTVGVSALLAIGLSEPAVLGKVRYYAKKTVPELLQAV
jgi:CheY-like chemotaxis protein/predicted regulator of Ras-like GTPase activity (Roadblock/LC7/MglB family)